jgi:hypothetical protein
LWDKFFAVCDCAPQKAVPDDEAIFGGFEPIPAPPELGMPSTAPLR